MLACPEVLPLPGMRAGALGVCAVRGSLVGAYDTGALLGHPRVAERPAWLLLAGDGTVALAFDRVDGRVRVSAAELAARAGKHVVDSAGIARAIVDVQQILASIQVDGSSPASEE